MFKVNTSNGVMTGLYKSSSPPSRAKPGSHLRNASDKTETYKPKVAVIGAGVAGLRTAQVLLMNGCEVQVLEARDRIGGRVASTTALGKALDLGPNWIHGTIGNPIVELAIKANAVLYNPLDDETTLVSPSGQYIPTKEADEISTIMWNIFEEGVEYSQEHFDEIDPSIGFYTWYEEQVKLKVSDEGKRAMAFQLVDEIGSVVAGDIKKQSLKNLYLEKPIPGDNLIVASTYGPIVQELAKTALEAGCVKLYTPITKIERVDGQHRLTSKDGKETFTADAVVVTAPLGYLKRGEMVFNPPLPMQIQDSIANLGYGSLEKVYISFPTAFWGTDGSGFTVFLAPEYAMDTNPEPWQISIISLAHLPAPYDQPTLLFYIHAGCTHHVTTLLGDGSGGNRQKVIAFFKPYFSRLPNYSHESADCKPIDAVATNWTNDEYAGNGSYTNFPIPLVNGEKDIDAFQTGWAEEKLWFAGEHTAPLLGLASVSGAYWSGEIAAKKVLEEFGMELVEEIGTVDYPGIFGEETAEEMVERKQGSFDVIPVKAISVEV